jgi:hypothetical protein
MVVGATQKVQLRFGEYVSGDNLFEFDVFEFAE